MRHLLETRRNLQTKYGFEVRTDLLCDDWLTDRNGSFSFTACGRYPRRTCKNFQWFWCTIVRG